MKLISRPLVGVALALACGFELLAPTQSLARHGADRQSESSASVPGSKLGFDVVTIKPVDPAVPRGTYFRVEGRHAVAANVSLFDLLSFAYGLHLSQIANGPRWLSTSRYDVDGVLTTERRPNQDQQRILYQGLLASRFQLVFHYEERRLAVYALVLDKGGPRLQQSSRSPADGTTFSYTNQILLTVKNASMAAFADGMQATFLDRPVVDQTGLRDRYDFTLKWTRDDSPLNDQADAPPGLYTAIREQLGLRLVPTQAAAKVLVVDHVDMPSAN